MVKKEILEILKRPNLFNEITEKEFEKKIVGELRTRKVIFLCAAGGRLVENAQIASFNLLVNDVSGSGKDYVTKAVLEILPKDIYVKKTKISPAVFTYWHNSKFEPLWTWDGKVFYNEDISEISLNSDVFKVMCSSGSSATIVKDQRALEIEIKGKPVMITTTASAIPNPELMRRFGFTSLDSSQDQTRAIMKRHSEFRVKGIVPEYDYAYTEALACMERCKVKIPFAEKIYPHFSDHDIIMRTGYPRFLDFIAASAAFHQFQRKKDGEFIIAEGQDYDIARECFLVLCSNRFMIPLTINQKKIIEVFKQNPGLKEPATRLHPKMNFISLRGLLTNLNLLSQYRFLEVENQQGNYNKDIEVYSIAKDVVSNSQVDIPLFKDINTFQKANVPQETGRVEAVEAVEVLKGGWGEPEFDD